jgi:hypothetical protein
MNVDSRRGLEFEPVDFIPLAGLFTMYNRNNVRITNYPIETMGERAVFTTYQILATGAVLISGLYLAEKFF